MSASDSCNADIKGEMVYSFEDLDASVTYSYAHYLNWLFDDRVELIKGKIFRMSAAPSPYHQQISVRIASELFLFLKSNGWDPLESTCRHASLSIL